MSHIFFVINNIKYFPPLLDKQLKLLDKLWLIESLDAKSYMK